MNRLTIIHEDGCAPRTHNMSLCQTVSHIAARDRWADEALILLEYSKIEDGRVPGAWKYADPTEGARFVFDTSDLLAIERQDPSLIVRLQIVDGDEKTFSFTQGCVTCEVTAMTAKEALDDLNGELDKFCEPLPAPGCIERLVIDVREFTLDHLTYVYAHGEELDVETFKRGEGN